MVTIFKLNNNKHFQNFFFFWFCCRLLIYLSVLFVVFRF